MAKPEPRTRRKVEDRAHVAGQVVGLPGHLEVVPAQDLPVIGVRRHVVGPLLSESGGQRVEGLYLGGAGPAGEAEVRAVLEPVLSDEVEGLQVDLALEGATGLAEQVAHDGGQQGGGGAGVPGEPVERLGRQRATEGGGALEQVDLVAQLGQSGGNGHACEAATDHRHPRHG